MAKIIVLSRVSSAPQHIESQTNDLIKKAEQLGYPIENQIVIEEVESAIKLSEEERRGLTRMKEYIESDPEIDCVICWEPSRIARQQKTLYSIRDYLVERKIQLYILNPFVKLLTPDRSRIDTTASIVFSLFSTIAENEMMIKKERFMRAKADLTRQGKKSAGSVKFGYMKDKDKYCIADPVTSVIVADLFSHYVNVADSSFWETYEYASSKWPVYFPLTTYIKGQHRMRNILNLEWYAYGNWCYPPIITPDIFEKAKEKMKKAVCRPRYKSKLEILGRGKVRCKHCGNIMTGIGGNVNAYYCSTDKEHRLQMNIQVLDWLIWRVVPSAANIYRLVNNAETVNEMKSRISQKETILNQLSDKISESTEKEDKLVSLLLDSKISQQVYNKRYDELKRDTDVLKAEYEKIKNQIVEMKVINKNAQELDIADIMDLYNVQEFSTRLEYVRKFLRDIELEKTDNGEIRIHFNWFGDLPIPTSDYIYQGKGGNPIIWQINPEGGKTMIYNKKMNIM